MYHNKTLAAFHLLSNYIIRAARSGSLQTRFIGNWHDALPDVGRIGNPTYAAPPDMLVYHGKSQRASGPSRTFHCS